MPVIPVSMSVPEMLQKYNIIIKYFKVRYKKKHAFQAILIHIPLHSERYMLHRLSRWKKANHTLG